MENLFRAYMKTADAIKQKIESLKIKDIETDDINEKKRISKLSDMLYSEYLDVLHSAKMIENYFKPKSDTSISRTGKRT